MTRTTHLSLPSPAATTRLARWLAPRLRPGDVLLLEGPIGAGKTHFARALIQTLLAAPEDIPSPTFTLVQTYLSADGSEIWHADLYRLTHPDEVMELGLEAAFETAICLVEWPDRLGAEAPRDALTLRFSDAAGEGARELDLSAPARWQPLIDALALRSEGADA